MVAKAIPLERWKSLFLSLSFSIFLGLLSQIKINLPFTPVPLTLQTLGLLFLSYYLPLVWSIFSVIFYLILGSMGLPFFSGGKGGLLILSGPTGGYLLGFIFMVYLVGWAKERGFFAKPWSTILSAFLGHLSVYFFGILWFMTSYSKFGWWHDLKQLLILTVLPFLPSDLVKCFLFASFIYVEKMVRTR